MSISVVNSRDFCSGLLFLSVGIGGSWLAAAHSMGNAMRMGPGYFPLLLAVVLALLGGVLLARSVRFNEEPQHEPLLHSLSLHWRPALFVVAGVLAFAFLAQEQGLVLAILVLTLLSGLARRGVHLPELLGLSAGLALFGVVVFSFGLGLPLPVLPAGMSGAV